MLFFGLSFSEVTVRKIISQMFPADTGKQLLICSEGAAVLHI